MDLRERVLAAVARGTPRKEIVRTLSVSEPTIRRYLRLRRETGSVAPKPPIPNALSRSARASSRGELCGTSSKSTMTALWRNIAGCGRESKGLRSLSVSTMSRAIRRLGFGSSKKECGCLRTKRREEERSAWRERVEEIDPARFVFFVDEYGTNITLFEEALRKSTQRRRAGLR